MLAGPLGVPTVMRRKCGCRASRSRSLMTPKAISWRASFSTSGATSILANAAATRPSVSARRFTRSTLVAKFGSAASCLVADDVFRQHAPFAVVLDRDQDVDAVFGLEGAVGRDRDVRQTDALRRIAALVLEQRHRHPVRHGVEHRDRNRGALAGRRRAPAALPGSPHRRSCRRRCRTTDTPTRAGASGPPVIEDKPNSAWINMS